MCYRAIIGLCGLAGSSYFYLSYGNGPSFICSRLICEEVIKANSLFAAICEKVIKANSVFAAIRRTFKYLNAETFLPIYKTLVRTHLEYANSVWAPYKKKHIDKIESVQKRATKQRSGLGNLSYPERLNKYIPTLASEGIWLRHTKYYIYEIWPRSKLISQEDIRFWHKIQHKNK